MMVMVIPFTTQHTMMCMMVMTVLVTGYGFEYYRHAHDDAWLCWPQYWL